MGQNKVFNSVKLHFCNWKYVNTSLPTVYVSIFESWKNMFFITRVCMYIWHESIYMRGTWQTWLFVYIIMENNVLPGRNLLLYREGFHIGRLPFCIFCWPIFLQMFSALVSPFSLKWKLVECNNFFRQNNMQSAFIFLNLFHY